MTRCNVAQRLALAVDRASTAQPSLKTKRVWPYSVRHTTAMHQLQSGLPFNVIALWLGHESTNTTHRYVGCRPQGRRARSAAANAAIPGATAG